LKLIRAGELFADRKADFHYRSILKERAIKVQIYYRQIMYQYSSEAQLQAEEHLFCTAFSVFPIHGQGVDADG
jgi:hypothetical protein